MTANDFYEKFKKGAHHALKKSFKVLVLTAYVNLSFTPTFAMLSQDDEAFKNKPNASKLTQQQEDDIKKWAESIKKEKNRQKALFINPLTQNVPENSPLTVPSPVSSNSSLDNPLTPSLVEDLNDTSKTSPKTQKEIALQAKKDFETGMKYFNSRQLDKACQWFKKAALQGDIDAQVSLAKMYESGQGIHKNYKNACWWFYNASKNGDNRAQEGLLKSVKALETLVDKWDSNAQFDLAQMYEGGQNGVSQDLKKAISLYEQAANQCHIGAQKTLGDLYFDGQIVPKDLKKALEWYEKAALQGDITAQETLGNIYFDGQIVPKDLEKAFGWYEKAALQGHANSQRNLGLMYSLGLGVTQDYQKGIEWYEKAANHGLEKIQHVLGVIYQEGKGISKDYKKAFEWFEKAANKGFQESQYKLGFMYENGQGTQQDLEKSFEWYEKAALQGHPGSQTALGLIFFLGSGVAQDLDKALEWFLKAANQSDIGAQKILATFYYNGHSVLQNFQTAFEWYEKAALQGDTASQLSLAQMYEKGQGFQKNYKKALEWYEKAAQSGDKRAQEGLYRSFNALEALAEEGDDTAQFGVAKMYERGEKGVSQDFKKAFKWYEKAARQGHTSSQRALGFMYQKGSGVQKNYKKSCKWFYKATKKGDQHAQDGFNNSFKALQALADEGDLNAQVSLAKMYESGQKGLFINPLTQNVPENSPLTVPSPVSSNSSLDKPLTPSLVEDLNDTSKTSQKTQKEIALQAKKDFETGMKYFNSRELDNASQWFKKAAFQGNIDAQVSLAKMYESGQGVQKSYKNACWWFYNASQNGDNRAQEGLSKSIKALEALVAKWDSNAQFDLAQMYEGGQNGVSQDLKKAISLYEKAANQCHIEAQKTLGNIYFDGQIVPKDLEKAFGWYEKAALQGDTDAQETLGKIYFGDQIAPKDLKKAFGWYEKAALQGHADSQRNLGLMYFLGLGVTQDYQKSLQWYEKAANQGVAKTQYILGVTYQEGKGVSKNYKKAWQWYEKAANQGFKEAQYMLGLFYEQGKGAQQDLEKSFELYEKAALQGHPDSQRALGLMFFLGSGVSQDLDEALEWFFKAANQSDIGAQKILATFYYNGHSVLQNFQTAFEWYEKAALQGDIDAQLSLAQMYEKGQSVQKNYKKALEWYEKAAQNGDKRAQEGLCKSFKALETLAEKGDDTAQFDVAKMYERGEKGAQQDFKKAFKWYEKAARQGDTPSQRALGFMYQKGSGVQKDYKKSCKWFYKAAQKGDKRAQDGFNNSFKALQALADEGDLNAQLDLAKMYQKGKDGVSQDYKKALEWFYKGAQEENKGAQKGFENLLSLINPAFQTTFLNRLKTTDPLKKDQNSFQNLEFNATQKFSPEIHFRVKKKDSGLIVDIGSASESGKNLFEVELWNGKAKKTKRFKNLSRRLYLKEEDFNSFGFLDLFVKDLGTFWLSLGGSLEFLEQQDGFKNRYVNLNIAAPSDLTIQKNFLNSLTLESPKISLKEGVHVKRIKLKDPTNNLLEAFCTLGEKTTLENLTVVQGLLENTAPLVLQKLYLDKKGFFENAHVLEIQCSLKGGGNLLNLKELVLKEGLDLDLYFLGNSDLVTAQGSLRGAIHHLIQLEDSNSSKASPLFKGTQKLELYLKTVSNMKGQILGEKSTLLHVGKNFYNKDTVGDSASVTTQTTTLVLEPTDEPHTLGTVQGKEISFYPTSNNFNEGDLNLLNGTLQGKTSKFFGKTAFLKNITFNTPSVTLDVDDFFIPNQEDSFLNLIIKRASNKNFKLTHPYFSKGSITFIEDGVKPDTQTCKELLKTLYGEQGDKGKTTHEISFESNIKALSGMDFYTPHAKVIFGNENSENLPTITLVEEVPDQAQSQAPLKQKTYEMFERDGKNHSITGFCGEFDLQKATLMGDNFTLESPKGYTLGRLIRDQNRDVFATFFSHANCSGSHNLGGDIALSKYDLLGKAYTGVYDGRHLLILPYLIRNGSSLNFLNKGHFKGPLNHYCELETEELILEKKSTCIASKTTTRSLKIGDVVNLTMATGGTGTWSYYTYNGSRIGNSTPSWCFSNSEPAEFTVNGSTSGSGSIDNIASVFYSNAIEPGFKYSQQDFKSPLFQQVIGDTSHTRESLKQAKHREIGCGGEPDYPSNVTRPTNSYGSNGCSVYGVGFLVATNNFAGAQQIFKASNSSPHQKLQNASGGLVSLEGNTTTPTLILIKKPETTLAIGSKGAQTVTFESPRSDFGTSTQTLNTNLFKINDLSRFLQPSNPTSLFGSAQSPQSPLNPDPTTPTFIPEDIFTINRYYFKVTSRYEHTTLQDQEFYNQVEPFLVIEKNQDADTVTYEKPPVAGLRFFAHQPNQLLKWVQEETQKKLKRGHLYPYESMDLEVVKKLHKNGFDFLLKNETSTALVDPTTFKERLSDPILFYQEAEENGVVLYTPVLYFPPKWILESALGLNTQQLLILSSEMSIREMANTIMQHNPKLLDGFVKSIQSSPEMMLQLEQEEKPLSASDVNIDRSEPWQVEGEDLLFNEYYTSALNNECGFKSLGFGDKAQTISFLKEALSISKGTNLYDELFSLIVTELKTDQQRDPIFKRFSNTPEGIEKYLDYILTTPYMLNFEQHLQGLTPYGLLDALALILNKNVKIYEPTHEGSKKLVLTHTFIANPSLPTVFQNMIYRGLHFNTAVETTLKAQNTQALQREADFLNELKMSLTSPLSNTSQAQQSLGSVIFQGQNKADTGIIFTEGDVINHGSLYGVDWFVRSSSNILLESLKRRLGDSCNYREEVYSQASMEMSKTLTLIALGKIVMHGAKTFSGELTSLYALSGLLDMPLDLLEQQMYSWYNDDEEGTTTIKKLRKHQSHHSGNGSFKSFSGGGTDLVSSLFDFKKTHIQDKSYIKVHESHNTTHTHIEKKIEGDWLNGDEHVTSDHVSFESVGAKFNNPEGVIFEIVEDSTRTPLDHKPEISLTNTSILADPGSKAVFINKKGKVELKLGTEESHTSVHSKSKSVLWQSADGYTSSAKTFVMPEINCPLEVNAQTVVLEDLQGHFKSFAVEGVYQDLARRTLQNHFESSSYSVGGPSVALCALVGIVVAVATAGVGAQVGAAITGAGAATAGATAGAATAGATAGATVAASAGATVATTTATTAALTGATGAMWNAGFSAVCAKTATSFLSCNGNLGNVVKDLSSEAFLKSLLVTIATAGIQSSLTSHFNMKTDFKGMDVSDDLVGRLKLASLREAVRAPLSLVIEGGDASDILRGSLKTVAIDTLGGFAAGKIGDLYNAGQSGAKIGYVEHKALHALVGAGIGGILSDDTLKGAINGAVSALVTAVVTEIQTDRLYQTLAEDEEIDVESYLDDMDKITMRSKIMAALSATLLGQDPNIALKVSDNLVSNNCLPILAIIVVRAVAIQLLKNAAKKAATELAKKALKEGGKKALKEVVKKEIKKQGKEIAKKGLSQKGAKQGKKHLKKYGERDSQEVTLQLKFKEGMDPKAFGRKTNHLQKAAKEGKLEAVVPHGFSKSQKSYATKSYRRALEKRINRMYKNNDTARENALSKLRNSDIDHKIDLQLGGSNTKENLQSLDSFTNQDLGRQIAQQLKKENGKIISDIIIKK